MNSSRVRASQLGRESTCFVLAFGGDSSLDQAELVAKIHSIVSNAVFIRSTPYGPIFGLENEVDLLILIRSSPITLRDGQMIGFCPPVEFEGIVQYATPYRQLSVYSGTGEVIIYVINIVIFALVIGALVNGTTFVRDLSISLGYMLTGLLFLYFVFVALRLVSNWRYARL
ncbi:Hypothetical protein GLP15_1375 [Giardia lamblia P15]|uniref:Uncharacterized protein n=1 Tax=Giardia intestinalis (strain P15) TaxID=658858 RepID=E1EZB2_GIAIA|nr:Hypothetical protein GLP15_1375 [Giardia lamblia P15]